MSSKTATTSAAASAASMKSWKGTTTPMTMTSKRISKRSASKFRNEEDDRKGARTSGRTNRKDADDDEHDWDEKHHKDNEENARGRQGEGTTTIDAPSSSSTTTDASAAAVSSPSTSTAAAAAAAAADACAATMGTVAMNASSETSSNEKSDDLVVATLVDGVHDHRHNDNRRDLESNNENQNDHSSSLFDQRQSSEKVVEGHAAAVTWRTSFGERRVQIVLALLCLGLIGLAVGLVLGLYLHDKDGSDDRNRSNPDPTVSPSSSVPARQEFCNIQVNVSCGLWEEDDSNRCGPPMRQDSTCKNKVHALKMRYLGGLCERDRNLAPYLFFNCTDYNKDDMPTNNSDDEVHIVARKTNDASIKHFRGRVKIGEDFDLVHFDHSNEQDGPDPFQLINPSDLTTTVFIYEDDTELRLIQEVSFDANCARALYGILDIYGSVLFVAYNSDEDGSETIIRDVPCVCKYTISNDDLIDEEGNIVMESERATISSFSRFANKETTDLMEELLTIGSEVATADNSDIKGQVTTDPSNGTGDPADESIIIINPGTTLVLVEEAIFQVDPMVNAGQVYMWVNISAQTSTYGQHQGSTCHQSIQFK